MCLFGSRPAPPPPPPAPPSREDPELRQRQEEERRRARAAQGRGATIMTGGLGDPAFGQSSRQATLMGAPG